MKLLRELLTIGQISEQIDNMVDIGPDYVQATQPTSKNKKASLTGKKKRSVGDQAQRQLINNIWFYNNADAT
jgi:hypothetical protein